MFWKCIFNQTNYTSYYGGGSVISNFEHNHVLRASLTSLLGNQIPSSELLANNVYETNFYSHQFLQILLIMKI